MSIEPILATNIRNMTSSIDAVHSESREDIKKRIARSYIADKPNYGDPYDHYFYKAIYQKLHFSKIPPNLRTFDMFLVYLDAMICGCLHKNEYFLNRRNSIIAYVLSIAPPVIKLQPEIWARIYLITHPTEYINGFKLRNNELICKTLVTLDPEYISVFLPTIRGNHDIWVTVLTYHPAYLPEARIYVTDFNRLYEEALKNNPKVAEYATQEQKEKYEE